MGSLLSSLKEGFIHTFNKAYCIFCTALRVTILKKILFMRHRSYGCGTERRNKCCIGELKLAT